MSDVTIRSAEHDDIPALLALWRHLEHAQGPARVFPLRPDAEDMVMADLRSTIDADDGCVLVAEDGDGSLIAAATLWYWESTRSLDPMPIVDLSKMVVHPDHRARGIGSALLEEAEAFGRARGARYLQAHFFSGNEAGRAFWETRGFVPRYEARVRPILGADGER